MKVKEAVKQILDGVPVREAIAAASFGYYKPPISNVAVTLELVGNTKNLIVRTSMKAYKMFENIQCIPGGDVQFITMKDSCAFWKNLAGKLLGGAPLSKFNGSKGIRITVPENAEGHGVLEVNFGDSKSIGQQECFLDFNSPKTTGWVRTDECEPLKII